MPTSATDTRRTVAPTAWKLEDAKAQFSELVEFLEGLNMGGLDLTREPDLGRARGRPYREGLASGRDGRREG